jgi:L-lactate dehydrogenase complex protein LldG
VTENSIVEEFLKRCENVAAKTVRVHSAEELQAAVNERLSENDRVYCPAMTEREKALVVKKELRVDDCFSANVTVEEVLAGIVETGSIVCSSEGGRSLQASVLPERHIAIVPVDRIFNTLDDFFSRYNEDPPNNVTLITGPSRTADIELTLTVGVHGPKALDIIVA